MSVSIHKNILQRLALQAIFLFLLGLVPAQMWAQQSKPVDNIKYLSNIQAADASFKSKAYDEALRSYKKAFQINPSQSYPGQQIEKINQLLAADEKLRNTLFENAILKGENLFKTKNYASAKSEFQKALDMDPTAQYAKDRLAAISKVYVDPEDQANYMEAIISGDIALGENEFDKAINWYEVAQMVKPDAEEARIKIVSTKKLKEEYNKKKSQYDKLIAAADKFDKEKKYSDALVQYQQASDIFPNESYPKQKIDSLSKFLKNEKEIQERLDKVIEIADQFYVARDFTNARVKYEEALKIKPSARYPKEMLVKIASGEQQKMSKKEHYDALIAAADKLFKSGDLNAALIAYQSALKLYPEDSYIKNRITEIENLLAERAKGEADYATTIKNGEAAFTAKNWNEALASFESANRLKPEESLPKDKIAEINKILGDLKSKDENYLSLIADADQKFSAANYPEAISLYQNALKIKPTEKYPQDKIMEINKLMSELKSKDEQFALAVKEGDKFLSTNKQQEALTSFEKATTIKPNEEYPKIKIAEINTKLEAIKSENEGYQTKIASADAFLNQQKLHESLEQYRSAATMKPNEKYPLQQISKIEKLLADQKLTDQKYEQLIVDADKYFASNQLQLSLVSYQEALKVKPSETYPQTKIAEITAAFADAKNKDENYSKFILQGNSAFTAKNWNEALASFESANRLKPEESLPKDKIAEINKILGDLKSKDENYLSLIADADQKFSAANYPEAISLYQNALKIKPTEKYPQDKIMEINKLISELKSKDEQFALAVKEGDKFLSTNKQQEALTSFEKATTIKPNEEYPKTKIAEINTKLEAIKSENEGYQTKIASADAFLNQQKLHESLEQYRSAATMKPNEKYPLQQISKIEKLLADQKLTDQKYEQLIVDADKYFASNQLQLSLVSYQEALKVKPSETYPQTKIAEITAAFADAKNKDENYSKFILQGNSAFTAKNWNEALASFESANRLKPEESLPKDKIAEINKILGDLKSKDENYLSLIADADQKFSAANYPEAISLYQNALKIKPTEKYPQDKIMEINKLMSELKSKDEQFALAVKEGDKFLSTNKQQEALTSFEKATTIKPNEEYPKIKIAEINTKLEAIKSENEGYQTKIASADAFLNQQKLHESLEQYRSAATMKPNEKYPLQQISKIEKLLADQKLTDQKYEQLIVDADKYFASNQLQLSLVSYQEALKVKPSETYPQTKIAEITAAFADAKNKDENYSKFILQGNSAFTAKNWNEALASFESANRLKPEESLPKDKIAEINKILGDLKSKDENYLSLIADADQKFSAANYPEAISLYQNALKIKPTEKYPQDKIMEINKLMSELKSKDEQFALAVKEGDKFLSTNKQQEALTSFEKATTIKPNEEYPKIKIAEINTKLEAIKSENEGYQTKIASADAFLNQQKLHESLEQYRSAATMKPNEKYPLQQISKIEKLLADQKLTDQKYEQLIVDADKYFASNQLQLSLVSYQEALKVKPSETYPQTKIAEITAAFADAKNKDETFSKLAAQGDAAYLKKELQAALQAYQAALQVKSADLIVKNKETKVLSEIKMMEEQFAKAILEGDKKFSAKDYLAAINLYQSASELKPNDELPKTKMAAVNETLAREKDELERIYNGFISEGDKHLALQAYDAAKSAYSKALGTKPAEQYPKDKIAEITKITAEHDQALKAEYDKAIAIADDLYRKKILDESLEAYEKATNIKPDEPHASEMVRKIRQYISDHAIQDVSNQQLTIKDGEEKKFTIAPIEIRMRKNNFIVIRAKSGSSAPKVFLNYGKDAQKNGGIVLRAIGNEKQSDYIIPMSNQDRWYREDNNWISIYVEGGEVEISRVQVLAGE